VAEELAYEFSWDFLEVISRWSLGIAAVVSAVMWVVTGQPTFAIGCMLAASIDFAFVRAIASSARTDIREGRPGARTASVLFVVRLAAKVGLLLLAALYPQVLGFAGTVVGVLCYDLTLAFVGSLIAASRLMRGSRIGR
jgi:hypothetical protein